MTFYYHSLYEFTGVTEHSQNDVHNDLIKLFCSIWPSNCRNFEHVKFEHEKWGANLGASLYSGGMASQPSPRRNATGCPQQVGYCVSGSWNLGIDTTYGQTGSTIQTAGPTNHVSAWLAELNGEVARHGQHARHLREDHCENVARVQHDGEDVTRMP